ncbi:MAG TPA: bifunctional phosphoribosylaminoimidazolecarboxamide formyltransferase/IMP cyclohydrolase [Thermoanaerobaculia bacterium]|jgi:phosphoribosylaminoimidazolecarboxamide formyltransferase/IMP cyclohydrolase|nr:bifunctional phosphoribosylaminoimidazolecarboxamide formyltransferase/IMP cyclohydrolase [Thermoanaerobaculia bacterium]
MLPARRALISVYDKRGLEVLARGLSRLGVEIVSTGGTLKFLEEKGIPVTGVSGVTGFPEILDGRVKTLHPKVHGGILANREVPEHLDALAAHGIDRIDVVVVNLYPFRETVARGASFEVTIEMIDVGGPTMVRAAAKNAGGVAVIVDPDDYSRVLAALEEGGGVVPERLRRELALKAFRETAGYDAAISEWLAGQEGPSAEEAFPERKTLELKREMVLRYGENPHQGGAVYGIDGGAGVFGGFAALQGKELSWNNLLDADAARKMAGMFDGTAEAAVVIVKHNNPCGIGRGADLVEAYQRAVATDPVSAFGSVIALNREADGALAGAMADLFVEVLLAPGFSPEARERFAAKKNLRLIECPLYRPEAGEIELRALDGGFLAQPPDGYPDDTASWTCPTKRQPTVEERRALEFAWKIVRYVKSNAIVVANGDQTVGVGAGQMSRVDSCRLAVEKAQLPVTGTVAASDAFFPFRDGVDVLIQAGVTAIVQPGGSKRDDEAIAAADEAGVAMLFTGGRHFRH